MTVRPRRSSCWVWVHRVSSRRARAGSSNGSMPRPAIHSSGVSRTPGRRAASSQARVVLPAPGSPHMRIRRAIGFLSVGAGTTRAFIQAYEVWGCHGGTDGDGARGERGRGGGFPSAAGGRAAAAGGVHRGGGSDGRAGRPGGVAAGSGGVGGVPGGAVRPRRVAVLPR